MVTYLAMGVTSALAAGQKPRKPASKSDIIGLLEAGVPSKEIEDAVKQYGVSFELTRQTETELRDAGATDGLIRAIRAAAPHPSAPPVRPPASNSPPPPSPPVLVIQTTPGGAQVYVDDEPIGTTSPEGRLKLSTLATGQHKVRLSLQGRRDFEQTIELTAGETATLPVTLEVARAEPSPVPQAPSRQPSTGPPSGPQAETPRRNLVTFSVAHDHGGSGMVQGNYCVGVMAIGNGIVHYRSTNGVHSFDFPAAEIKEIKKNGVYLANLGAFHIRMQRGPAYNFVVINAYGQYQHPDQILNVLQQATGK